MDFVKKSSVVETVLQCISTFSGLNGLSCNNDVRAKAAVSSHQGQQSAERPNCIFLTGGVQSSPGGRCGAGKQIWLNDHFRYVESTLLMNSFGQCIDSVKLTCTIKLSFRGCTISI